MKLKTNSITNKQTVNNGGIVELWRINEWIFWGFMAIKRPEEIVFNKLITKKDFNFFLFN